MFTKSLATALASAVLFTGLAQSPAFANEGGGGGEAFHLRGPVVQERNEGRIQWRTNRKGTVEATDTGAPRPAPRPARHKRAHIKTRVLPNGTIEAVDVGPGAPAGPEHRDSAVSHDRDTGQRTGSFERAGGGRTVISVGPLGLSIGISIW